RAVDRLLQRGRRRPLHPAVLLRLAAEPGLHRTALRGRRAGLGLSHLRDAGHRPAVAVAVGFPPELPMRAVTIKDKNLTVEDHPDPTPNTGECLVQVKAAGLNGADMMQRRGLSPAPPGAPQDIPGLELAG